VATLAGAAAGAITGIVHTKLRINNIISGIIVMTAIYSVNLRVMGRSNTPLLTTGSVFEDVIAGLGEPVLAAGRDVAVVRWWRDHQRHRRLRPDRQQQNPVATRPAFGPGCRDHGRREPPAAPRVSAAGGVRPGSRPAWP